MMDEPEIVKELREAEKLGILQSKIESNYEKLEMQEESLDETPDKSIYMVEDAIKRTRDDGELGDLEEKYRLAFENYTIAITLADNKERIVSWNKYTEELLNMTQNELYLKPASSLYPPEEWQKIRAENVRQKGIKYCMETRMIRKNQGCFDVELSLCVLRGKEGKTIGSVGIIKDITRLKETERELKTSEERYRTIFENSAVAITLTDENERIISWNKCTEDLLGVGKEDLYLKPVESLYPLDEWQKIRAENIRKKGLQHHLETRMVKKNNELINVDLSLSVLKNHEGKVIGSIGVTRDITERKQIERALEKSEEKFKQLYEQAPVPYHTLSPAGSITDVNKKWCQILGYTKEKVLGRAIFDFVTENEREVAKSSFEKKIQDKKSYTGGHERTYITKDEKGKIFVIHDFFSYDKDDKVVSIQTIMEDITERKKTEGALRESEERYRDLFENANDLIQSVDNSGSFVYVNKKWLKTLGYSKNELEKLKLTNILRKDQIPHCMELFKKVCEGEVLEHIEAVFVSKDGKEIYVEGNVNPWFKDGKFIATRGIFRDITDRKQAEELLQKSEDKFRTLAEHSPNMIFINKKGRVVYANRKCEEIMGYKREEFYSPDFDFLTLMAPESKDLVKTAFRKHMNGEEVAPYEYTIITKDGKKIEAIIASKLIKYEEDIAILEIVTDIAEQKKTEGELRKAHRNVAKLNQELEQKVEARTADVEKLLKQKNEFIAQLGHDLKSPLTPLVCLLPLLEKREKDSKSKELIEILHRNIDRMNNIVCKTLKFAELNTPGTTKFITEDIKLWEEAENSIKDQQMMYDEKGITFENKIDENIFVKADKLRLSEVLNNLINNAVKYNPLGGNITVDAHDDGDFVTVSVTDSGIGMTTEQIDHIFDEFYKADESRHDFKSSGLGLSICKRIVEIHGGKIWAESPGLGKGSTFYFTIPIGSKISKEDVSEKVKEVLDY